MKKKVIEFLKDKGVYHSGYDFLINLLVDQISFYKQVKRALKNEGITVSGNAEGSFQVRNQHLRTLQEIIQSIMQITRKLAISPKDFNDLNLIETEEEDEFDEIKKLKNKK